MKWVRFLAIPLAVITMPFMIGCGPGGTIVKGVVELDGKTVSGATVNFLPSDGKGDAPSALTGLDGSFTITSSGDANRGIQAGTYKVLVSKTEAVAGSAPDPSNPGNMKDYLKMMKSASSGPKSSLPIKYSKFDSTPLTVQVPPPSMPIKLELSSK